MFHVEWLPDATNELTRIWLSADSATRQTITSASHEIDRRLARNPNDEGESRPDDTRITFAAPLAAKFTVDDVTRLVTVLDVSFYARRSRP